MYSSRGYVYFLFVVRRECFSVFLFKYLGKFIPLSLLIHTLTQSNYVYLRKSRITFQQTPREELKFAELSSVRSTGTGVCCLVVSVGIGPSQINVGKCGKDFV